MQDILSGTADQCFSIYANKRITGPDGKEYAVVEVWNGANGVFCGGFYGGGAVMCAALAVERFNEKKIMQYQIRWKNIPPYYWEASIDGGTTWLHLNSSNEEESFEPIEEAAKRFGIPTNKWELIDD